jgi:hypothetical protein
VDGVVLIFKMKKLLIILMMGMMLLTLVSAEANRCGNENYYLGEFKINSYFGLTQTCDDSSYSNMTAIKYPDGTYESFNLAMTKDGDNYNYTFFNTSQIGCYTYTISCDVAGVVTSDNTDFQITPSGFVNTLGFYLLILLFSAGIIVLGFNREDPITVILGTLGLYFVGLYILFNGLDGIRDLVYTRSIAFIVLGIAGYFSIRSAHELITD